MSSSPLVSPMACPVHPGWVQRRMVSPRPAAAISARSEPVPLSRLFMTVSVLSTSRRSSGSG